MVPYQDLSREAKRGEWVGEDSRRVGLALQSDARVLAVGRLPAGTLYYLDRRLTPVAVEDARGHAAEAPPGTAILIPLASSGTIASWPSGFDVVGALRSSFQGTSYVRSSTPARGSERERVYYLERVPG
jgi:hypothetical protein